MKKGLTAEAKSFVALTQRILQKVGIDPIFGRDNLVWAPNWGTHASGSAPAPNTTAQGYTGKGYAQAVYDILKDTQKTKPAIQLKLKEIAIEFIQGVW